MSSVQNGKRDGSPLRGAMVIEKDEELTKEEIVDKVIHIILDFLNKIQDLKSSNDDYYYGFTSKDEIIEYINLIRFSLDKCNRLFFKQYLLLYFELFYKEQMFYDYQDVKKFISKELKDYEYITQKEGNIIQSEHEKIKKNIFHVILNFKKYIFRILLDY
jgi:hypothetical protein